MDEMAEAAQEQKVAPREVKRAPNRLIVDEAHGDGDNSCIMLSLAKMEGSPAQFVSITLSNITPHRVELVSGRYRHDQG